MESFVVGIAGGSGSGKTTFCKSLINEIGASNTALIHHDSYYADLGHLPRQQADAINFDHPDAIETRLLCHHLSELKSGREIELPEYDFSTHTRTDRTQTVNPARLILVEGVLVFADESLAEIFDLRLFICASETERLRRRIERDVQSRGRSVASVERQWAETVQPMFEEFVEPSRRKAHLIIPMDSWNPEAVAILAQGVLSRLR